MQNKTHFINGVTGIRAEVVTDGSADHDQADSGVNDGLKAYSQFLFGVSGQTSGKLAKALAWPLFEEITILEHTVALWVPSRDRQGQFIDHQKLVRFVEKKFRSIFGGATLIHAVGSMGEVLEVVTVISAFITKAMLGQNLRYVIELAQDIKRANQQSVLLKVDEVVLLLK